MSALPTVTPFEAKRLANAASDKAGIESRLATKLIGIAEEFTVDEMIRIHAGALRTATAYLRSRGVDMSGWCP